MQEECRDMSSGKHGIKDVGQIYYEGGPSKMLVFSFILGQVLCSRRVI